MGRGKKDFKLDYLSSLDFLLENRCILWRVLVYKQSSSVQLHYTYQLCSDVVWGTWSLDKPILPTVLR